MFYLLRANTSYNIYSTVYRDTTGSWESIKYAFNEIHFIGNRPNRYRDLADFIQQTSFKTIICSFEDPMTYDEFQQHFPELLI